MKRKEIREIEKAFGVKIQRKEKRSFLAFMVKTVFLSTFIFTGVAFYFAWIKDWQTVVEVLVERWFTIMVGQLIVSGLIQIAKEFAHSRVEKTAIENNCFEEEQNEY